jgi:hypothetical protein
MKGFRGRCGVTRKIRFGSHEAALMRAGEILNKPGCNLRELSAYFCIYCGGWHLTSNRKKFTI